MVKCNWFFKEAAIYAIVATGGKQYKVSPGQVIKVERLPGEEGTSVELGEVILIAEDGKIITGRPFLEGAKVKATILSQGKDQKVIVFKYKPKIRYRRKRGHRQPYTKLLIEQIILNEKSWG